MFTYVPPAIIEAFHSIPRYNYHLQSIPNDFTADFSHGAGQTYFAGVILQAAGFFGYAVLISFIFGIVFLALKCFRTNMNQVIQYYTQSTVKCPQLCSRCTFGITSLFTLGFTIMAIAAAGYAGSNLMKAFFDLRDASQAMAQAVQISNNNYPAQSSLLTTNLNALVTAATGTPFSGSATSLSTAGTSLVTELATFTTNMNETFGALTRNLYLGPDGDDDDDDDHDDDDHASAPSGYHAPPPGNVRGPMPPPSGGKNPPQGINLQGTPAIVSHATIGLGSTIIIFFLLQLCCLRNKPRPARCFRFSVCISWVLGLLLPVLGGFIYAVSLIGSDICMDPTLNTLKILNITDMNSFGAQTIGYYSLCGDNAGLPVTGAAASIAQINTDTNNFQTQLLALNTSIATTGTVVQQQQLFPIVNNLYASVLTTSYATTNATTFLVCEAINPSWKRAVEHTCTDGIVGMDIAAIGAGLASLMYFFYLVMAAYIFDHHPGLLVAPGQPPETSPNAPGYLPPSTGYQPVADWGKTTTTTTTTAIVVNPHGYPTAPYGYPPSVAGAPSGEYAVLIPNGPVRGNGPRL